ncbi:MAG TPA: lysoplasmalogenase family protein [Tissierellaceae bacterium]|nr:lysoplasmalogenase family protein [Tissierellaceae bacterium]
MEHISNKSKIVKRLLIILAVFYAIFMYMDLFKLQAFRYSNILKFVSMILIFIISFMTGRNALGDKDILLLRTGLLITLIADVFLLLLNSNYILGIGLFSIVQIIYSIRYKPGKIKTIIRNFSILALILFFVYILINKFFLKIDFLLVIGLYYGICLLSSTSKAIQAYKNKSYPRINSKFIVLGMILFLFCDINVALYNVIKSTAMSHPFTTVLYNISFISMWLFYLPSQVLLSLSGYSSEFLEDIFVK